MRTLLGNPTNIFISYSNKLGSKYISNESFISHFQGSDSIWRKKKKTKENQIESLHTYKNQSQDQYLFVLNVQLKKKSEWIIKGCK